MDTRVTSCTQDAAGFTRRLDAFESGWKEYKRGEDQLQDIVVSFDQKIKATQDVGFRAAAAAAASSEKPERLEIDAFTTEI